MRGGAEPGGGGVRGGEATAAAARDRAADAARQGAGGAQGAQALRGRPRPSHTTQGASGAPIHHASRRQNLRGSVG